MDKKQTILWTLLFSILLFSVLAYAGTVTINNPTTGATIKGTSNKLNFTIALTGGADLNVTNVTWFYKSSSGGAWVVIGVNATGATGDTRNLTSYQRVWDVSGLSDASTYTLNVTVWNSTGPGLIVIGDGTIALTIDNTNPTATLTQVPASAKRKGEIDYRCDSSTDTIDTSLTFDVNLTNPNGANVTKTSSIATFSDLDLELGGNYLLACRVTDNANNTAAATANIWVSSDGAKEKQVTQSEIQKATLTSPLFIIIIGVSVIVIIIVIILFVILSSKKKR